ncbi:hypothetical protein NECAME_11786 [Necator americanus]|uniref:Uncharacterized protein n=1 Tax=Necator americanus TaxID=51031 RepID=W2T2R3_NECAM|nr:hypothetical protein NECAME_11786 [Necator americanus]ETN76280.1 hypothetical protein NECAME_11786 [Necator americanus]
MLSWFIASYVINDNTAHGCVVCVMDPCDNMIEISPFVIETHNSKKPLLAHIPLVLYATSWTSITAHVGHGRKLSRDREKQDAHCGSSLDVSLEGYGQHG